MTEHGAAFGTHEEVLVAYVVQMRAFQRIRLLFGVDAGTCDDGPLTGNAFLVVEVKEDDGVVLGVQFGLSDRIPARSAYDIRPAVLIEENAWVDARHFGQDRGFAPLSGSGVGGSDKEIPVPRDVSVDDVV